MEKYNIQFHCKSKDKKNEGNTYLKNDKMYMKQKYQHIRIKNNLIILFLILLDLLKIISSPGENNILSYHSPLLMHTNTICHYIPSGDMGKDGRCMYLQES